MKHFEPTKYQIQWKCHDKVAAFERFNRVTTGKRLSNYQLLLIGPLEFIFENVLISRRAYDIHRMHRIKMVKV